MEMMRILIHLEDTTGQQSKGLDLRGDRAWKTHLDMCTGVEPPELRKCLRYLIFPASDREMFNTVLAICQEQIKSRTRHTSSLHFSLISTWRWFLFPRTVRDKSTWQFPEWESEGNVCCWSGDLMLLTSIGAFAYGSTFTWWRF